MEKLHFQLYVVALIAVHQTTQMPVCAGPEAISKPAKTKLETSSTKTKKLSVQREKAKSPKTDEQFIARAIRNHVPEPGQFLKRRQRIWQALKRHYEEKKDISQLLRDYVELNDSVTRGTNWVMDDAGNYKRMRPLSARCRELEEKLDLPWQSVGK